MVKKYPGTTIEVLDLKKGSSKILFDGIFATGGITLSQVSNMTGLEPYLIQNWVKRRFVSSPVKKLYSKEQFARIVIINMLRETLQLESISNLVHAIGGEVDNEFDDLIKDDELYHRYVDMVSNVNINPQDSNSVPTAAEAATEDFEENLPNTKKELITILEAMFYAHSASLRIKECEEKLATIK